MRRIGRSKGLLLAVAVGFSLLSTGCRTTYYKAWETFGVEKRDILKENVEEARDEQEKAAEQFKDALTRLKEMYAFEGGDLEKTYDKLKSDYDRSASRAEAVRERIRDVEKVAGDLFSEWEKEIQNMESSRLAADSREKLRTTRQKYNDLHAAMIQAENSMDPVLRQFNDQVLYLKHNLNAAAIGSLRGEALNIEKEIQQLIEDMNASIAEADAFIQGLGAGE